MTFWEYLKRDGFAWYLLGPGLWMPLIVGGAANAAYSHIDGEASKAFGNGLPTAIGVLLALVIALITYQLNALTIDDMRHFIHSKKAGDGFDVIFVAIRWDALASVAWFLASMVLLLFSNECRFRLGMVILGAALSHLYASIQASFDFVDLKKRMAHELEAEADKLRKPEQRLAPP